MTEQGSTSPQWGLGFPGALTILFVALKLLGKIDWSWWWVLSPVWITLGSTILVAVLALALAYICRNK